MPSNSGIVITPMTMFTDRTVAVAWTVSRVIVVGLLTWMATALTVAEATTGPRIAIPVRLMVTVRTVATADTTGGAATTGAVIVIP
jgi:hypothetical protein